MGLRAGRMEPREPFLVPSVGLEGFEIRTALTGMFWIGWIAAPAVQLLPGHSCACHGLTCPSLLEPIAG